MTLFEIVISLFILSIALLGLDAMQLMSLKKAKSFYYFAVASQQLDNIRQRLFVNKSTHDAMLKEWNEENREVLPAGIGKISGRYPVYEIQILWGGYNKKECRNFQNNQSGCIKKMINVL